MEVRVIRVVRLLVKPHHAVANAVGNDAGTI